MEPSRHSVPWYVPAGVAILGGFIFGYDTGIISSASESIGLRFKTGDDKTIEGLVTSTVLMGAMLGALAGAFVLSALGRRYTSFIACIICFHGSTTAAMAPDIWTFLVLRFFEGFGIGLIAVFCPYYVSETAPPDKKGMFGVLFQLSLTFAIFLSTVLGWGILYELPITTPHNNEMNWRIMLGIGSIFPIMLAILTFFCVSDTLVLADEMRMPVHASAQNYDEGGWSELFSTRNTKPLLTGAMLAATLQLTGINAIMFYGPAIFKQVLPGDMPFKINIGLMLWNFVSTFIAVGLVERLGRRKLILGGTAVMTLSLFSAALCNTFIKDPHAQAAGFAVSLFAFVGGFEAGIGCLFWVLVNEVFPEKVRDKGGVYCNVLQWAFNLLVSYTFPLIIPGYITLFAFGSIGALCFLYMIMFLRVDHVETHLVYE